MPKSFQLPTGETVTINGADWRRVSALRWARKRAKHTTYVQASLPRVGGAQPKVVLHRFLLNAPAGVDVDHRDGDGLNNTRRNLRIASRLMNGRAYRRKNAGASSRYRGVIFVRRKPHHAGRWHAAINFTQGGSVRHKYLGSFVDEISAAEAFNAAAVKIGFPVEGLNKIYSS